jgi:hypothetical protein
MVKFATLVLRTLGARKKPASANKVANQEKTRGGKTITIV